MDRFDDKVVRIPESGCHIWIANTHLGYGLFKFEGKTRKAHRVAWALKNGPIPDGLQVRHKCDIRCCVNPDHMELGTQQDNEDDKVSRLRQARKLSPEEVLAIRADPRATRVVGKEYGISSMSVSDIKRRKYWKHLE